MTSSRRAILPPPPPPSIRLLWFLCTSWCALRTAAAQRFQRLARRWHTAEPALPVASGAGDRPSELRRSPLQPFVSGVVPAPTVAFVPALGGGRMTLEGVVHLRSSAPTTVHHRRAPSRISGKTVAAGRP